MSAPYDPGADEPTVVGRPPIGPLRMPSPPARPSGAAWSADAPSALAAPAFDWTAEPAVDAFEAVDAAPAAEGKGRAEGAPALPEDALISAAAPLLMVCAHLRNVVEQADVEALRREMAEQLRVYETRAARFGARPGDVSAGRYALAAFVDEAVMTTPWGSASAWSVSSLLREFHSETWGGEKVFAIVERARAQPVKYLALLKLLDACLSLGFEGKYRVLDDGRAQLARLRAELGRLVEQHGVSRPPALSAEARGASAARRLRNFAPLWIVFAAAGAIVLSVYGFVKWRVAVETPAAESALQSVIGPN
jgi:type VI secretion system protein ImpK